MTDDFGPSELSAESEPVVNMTGELVALGPLHRGLLPLIARWDNDFRTADLRGNDPLPLTAEVISATWEPLLRGERDDWLGFAIYVLPDLRPIGYTNIRDFTNSHGTAEFGISIGDPADRRRGYGTEATRLLLDYAFTVLGVYNVWLDTLAYNIGAIRAYEKAGFREIGRRRGAQLLAGCRYDVVLMDCLADEFIPPPTRALPDVDDLSP
ncbi:MAG: GNAT family N-acetyltransferase, partial [Chloroflexia bacterium]|nr:GNAT family N-acetyltransferase [Chloroflexia bacterium]